MVCCVDRTHWESTVISASTGSSVDTSSCECSFCCVNSNMYTDHCLFSDLCIVLSASYSDVRVYLTSNKCGDYCVLVLDDSY